MSKAMLKVSSCGKGDITLKCQFSDGYCGYNNGAVSLCYCIVGEIFQDFTGIVGIKKCKKC